MKNDSNHPDGKGDNLILNRLAGLAVLVAKTIAMLTLVLLLGTKYADACNYSYRNESGLWNFEVTELGSNPPYDYLPRMYLRYFPPPPCSDPNVLFEYSITTYFGTFQYMHAIPRDEAYNYVMGEMLKRMQACGGVGFFSNVNNNTCPIGYDNNIGPIRAGLDNTSMGSCPNGACLNSSVNYQSGNLFFSVDLFATRGVGPQVDFKLHYNSRDNTVGPLGRGWRHPYMTSVSSNAIGLGTLVEEDGRNSVFEASSTIVGLYVPMGQFGRGGANVTRYSDGSYRLLRKNGEQVFFDTAGRLARIVDRNGNAMTAGYTGSDLTTLTDATGRVTVLTYVDHKLTAVTDPAGHATTFGYDWQGNLETVTDPAGNIRRYAYDPSNRVQVKYDNRGNPVTYGYDAAGWLTSATDASNLPIAISHDPANFRSTLTARNGGTKTTVYDKILDMPLQVTDAEGNVTRYSYDVYRNLLASTDADNNVTRYTYDANGNRLTETDPLGRTTTFTYNGFGQVTSTTDPEGHRTVNEYDAAGNLKKITDAEGAVTTIDYDAQGKPTAMTAPGGKVSRYGYDSRGNVSSVTDPAGLTATFSYDLLGNLLTRTDANLATTTFAYDNLSRLVSVTDPLGRTTTYGYDPNGNRTTETDPLGHTTRHEYNAQDRLAATTDPLGHATRFDYGFGGCGSCGGGGDLLASITDPLGHATRFDHDLLGRRTRTTDPLGNAAWFDYDATGNLTDRTDPNGRTTSYAYDALSRATAQIDPADGITRFDFTPAGQTDNVVDANGHVTHYAYDNVGRLLQTLSPDTGTTAYGYHPDGTLATRTDANGIVTAYGYDNAARLTHIAFPDATQDVFFGYDSPQSAFGKGRLTSMTDPPGVTVYHYDALGRTTREEATILGVTYVTQYGYDNVGNLVSMIYPGGRTVSTAFDARHLPTGVTATVNAAQATVADSFAYDNAAQLRSFRMGNGLVQRYGYDAAGRLTSIEVPTITGLTYGFDPAGQIVSIFDNVVPAVSPGTEKQVDYTYTANRLTSLTEDNVASTVTHDAAGNTTFDGKRTFVYNQNQRLIEAWEAGTKRQENVYDGRGRRVIKRAGGVTTVFHYDQQNRLIAETDATGTTKVDYLWLGGAPLAQVRKAGSVESAYYYTTDQLGTPKAMTDNTQQVVWRVETDPFGNEIGNSIKTVENNLRFPGQYYDQETGLHQNYFRDYDPTLGRYIESDPIGLAGGINTYSYAANNPINLVDPDGMLPQVDGERWLGYVTDFFKDAPIVQMGKTIGADAAWIYGKITGDKAMVDEVSCSNEANKENNVELLANLFMLRGGVKSVGGGSNPFKGKTPTEIDIMFRNKGFDPRGPNPAAGEGGYVNPKTNRSFHIDPNNSFGEPPHVDVNRPRGYKGGLDKKKFFY
jgi:RHS repeat-associated protein